LIHGLIGSRTGAKKANGVRGLSTVLFNVQEVSDFSASLKSIKGEAKEDSGVTVTRG
jgi:hypothetical protein